MSVYSMYYALQLLLYYSLQFPPGQQYSYTKCLSGMYVTRNRAAHASSSSDRERNGEYSEN